MLPSDIARLVLVYLKDEGLTRAYQHFFKESPHLEELRQHPGVEPSVPHEKGLQEILTEYAKIVNAIKEQLSSDQLVSSLWKMHSEVTGQLRYHYTGNAGLLQVSPENRPVAQGVRSRQRLTGLRKQQELQRKLAGQFSDGTGSSGSDTPTNSSYSAIDSAHSAINAAHMAINPTQLVINSTQSVMHTTQSTANPTQSTINLAHPVLNPTQPVINSTRSVMSTTQSAINPAHLMINSTHSAINTTQSEISSAQSVINSTYRLINSNPLNPVDVENSVGRPQGDCSATQENQSRAIPLGVEVDIPASSKADTEKSREFQTLQETDFRTPVKNRGGGHPLDTPTGKSPKRKSAAPRRMQAAVPTTISPRSDIAASVSQWEEEVRDLPDVLESLINNIEFQEKLAQNINRARPVESLERDHQAEPIRVADSAPNPSDPSTTSIEELLNLHMSDNTIHDIVQKTSSDPAFESLFSLFNQNSQDGTIQQFTLSELPEETHPSGSNDVDQSSLPAAPHSNQSQCPSGHQGAGHVSHPSSNPIGTVSVSAGGLATEPTDAMVMTKTANSGQANGTGTQAAVTMTTSESQFQVVMPQFTTSVGTPVQSTNQVVTLPLVLNQADAGPLQQALQLASGGNSANVVANGPMGLSGGTIFLSPDGRILGTSGIVLQNGQPLQPNSLLQSVSVRQASVQEAAQNATPNDPDICPVHGRKAVASAVAGGPGPESAGIPISSADGQSDVATLLGSMVESDIGALLDCSPDKSQSGSRPSSDRPFRGVGSKERGTRSSVTTSQQRGGTANNNVNNNHSGVTPSQQLGQGILPAETPVTTQQSHEANESRNVFIAMSKECLGLSHASSTGTLGPRCATSSSEASPSETPLATSGAKQRKHLPFKTAFLSRPLDFGDSCNTEHVKVHLHVPDGQAPANPSQQQPEKPTKTATRGQRRKTKPVIQSITPSSDPVSGQKAPAASPSKPDHPITMPTKLTPQRVPPADSDMSVEVNIAAQMLVCLSNSPPSLRQSPLRRQRLQRSGCSPAKSPTRDHIAELRKEIGLTPRAGRLQPRPQADPPASLEPRVKDRGSEPHKKGSKTQAAPLPEQTQQDATASKRKSKMPRKQTHTVTETVVVTAPSEIRQKPKTPSKPAIQTRASLHKSKSPGKIGDDSLATRKSARHTKSPGRPTGSTEGQGAGSGGGGEGKMPDVDSKKEENRGLKRGREGNSKEEKNKKPKTSKNPKKGRKSQGFPSNLDVDKFLSSLQYAE